MLILSLFLLLMKMFCTKSTPVVSQINQLASVKAHKRFSSSIKSRPALREPCFFDSSTAFDTIRPALLGEKLKAVDTLLDCGLPDWQTAVHAPTVLHVRQSDHQHRGSAGDRPLSPPLLCYTTDSSYCTDTCHLQRFSDD